MRKLLFVLLITTIFGSCAGNKELIVVQNLKRSFDLSCKNDLLGVDIELRKSRVIFKDSTKKVIAVISGGGFFN